MNIADVTENLEKTAKVLRKYGFNFWADKLDTAKSKIGVNPDIEVIGSLKKLYGGFGTLMDLAVDPYELPKGISETEGNKELLERINELHRSLN